MHVRLTALVEEVRSQFRLDWQGIHGIQHFRRVRDNGLELAKSTGAKKHVVALFAFLHDSQRWGDGMDPDHGKRAAEYLESLDGEFFELEPNDFELLYLACKYHVGSGSYLGDDITIQTCWDSDRLDIGRTGPYPDASKLFTQAAKDPKMIKRAYQKSIEQTKFRFK